jgi:hypothetical protein
MLRSTFVCFVRTAVAAMFLSCVDAPVGFTFEALPPARRVEVHYESRGCFHEVAADLVFTRVAGGLTIQLRNASANLAPGWHMEVEQRLDMADLRRLDRMLTVYRRAGFGGCTNVSRLQIRWPNGGVGHFTESIVDSSCVYDERTDVRPFGSLLRVVSDSVKPAPIRGAT